MKFINTISRQLRSVKQKGVDLTSLQLRLTLGITTISLLGVGSIGTWTGWEMQQMLVGNHKQSMASVAESVPRELESANPNLPLTTRLQTAVADWSSPNLWLVIRRTDGAILAQSDAVPQELSANIAQLSAQSATMPEVYSVDERYLIFCQRSLRVNGQSIGQLYLVQDITRDYTVLNRLVNTLKLATLLAIAVIATLIALFIWRSLSPLRRMNRIAMEQMILNSTEGKLAPNDFNPEQMPSEVKAFVQAFSDLSTRLADAGEQQRQFTNSISHELRTSLCMVSGYLQSTLRRANNLTDAQKEALEVAAAETERTIQLLRDLLDLARTNSGSMQFDLRLLVLNDVVQDVIQQMKCVDLSRVDLKVNDPMIVAWADQHQLKRVLVQLIDNAIRFSGANQPITLTLSQVSDKALIQVSDRGCGIPPSEQSRIFEPFYRVEVSRCRATGGIGLGLAIVKALVEGMEGQISVQSTPSYGSTFTVTLRTECRKRNKN